MNTAARAARSRSGANVRAATPSNIPAMAALRWNAVTGHPGLLQKRTAVVIVSRRIRLAGRRRPAIIAACRPVLRRASPMAAPKTVLIVDDDYELVEGLRM